MGLPPRKPERCDWCGRKARIIHWLGIASALVCWDCFQGPACDGFIAARQPAEAPENGGVG